MDPVEWNSDSSMSKIEKRIQRSTFTVNSNNLSQKSRLSAISFTQNSVLTSSLTAFSISQTLQSFLHNNPKELDLSGVSRINDIADISNRLQEVIRMASPGFSLQLPGQKLQFDGLIIPSPISIRGSPGTIIEIIKGSIAIDFNSHSKESVCDFPYRVEISEVSIQVYQDRDRNGLAQALFIIDSPNAQLEVRDSDIKSIVSDYSLAFDCCFWVNGYAMKSNGINEGNQSLIVKSCNLSYFYHGVKSGLNANLTIERSHISQIQAQGVCAVNPKNLLIKKSVLEDCGKSVVEIKLANNLQVKSSSQTQSIELEERSIYIKGNDIRQCEDYGLYIWSDHLVQQPLKIYVKKNVFLNTKKEGLAIRHISVMRADILQNDFKITQGTGCWLQKVYKFNENSMINIIQNRFQDSQMGYGMYLYDTSARIVGNECCRNSIGGFMIVGSSSANGLINENLKIKNCLIYNNAENGVTIQNYNKGKVKIYKTKIFDNYQNGVYLISNREAQSTKNTSSVAPNIVEQGTVKIQNCEIYGNKQYGITTSKILCQIDKTTIKDNLEGAVSMDEGSKDLLHVVQAEDTRQYIRGNIGGQWGQLYNQKKKSCGNKECRLL